MLLAVASEAEAFSRFLEHATGRLRSLVFHSSVRLRLGNLALLFFVVGDLPWVLAAMRGHLHLSRPHLRHHLLLHHVLVAHRDGNEELRNTLDEAEDEASHQGLLEGHRSTTSDGQNSSRDAAGHDGV